MELLGSQVSDLYVDGMTTEQFLAATGLQLDLHKGGFVLSRRISRIMRPHFVSGFFDPADVRIAYMAQSPAEAKVWDGAGLISRRMLRKLALGEAGGDALSPAKRERLEAELRHAQRVEFTVMTAKGQDKGHAIVADDLRDEDGRPVDFLLPEDTKREVRLTAGPFGKPGAGRPAFAAACLPAASIHQLAGGGGGAGGGAARTNIEAGERGGAAEAGSGTETTAAADQLPAKPAETGEPDEGQQSGPALMG